MARRGQYSRAADSFNDVGKADPAAALAALAS
jgi:hypothetical protein